MSYMTTADTRFNLIRQFVRFFTEAAFDTRYTDTAPVSQATLAAAQEIALIWTRWNSNDFEGTCDWSGPLDLLAGDEHNVYAVAAAREFARLMAIPEKVPSCFEFEDIHSFVAHTSPPQVTTPSANSKVVDLMAALEASVNAAKAEAAKRRAK